MSISEDILENEIKPYFDIIDLWNYRLVSHDWYDEYTRRISQHLGDVGLYRYAIKNDLGLLHQLLSKGGLSYLKLGDLDLLQRYALAVNIDAMKMFIAEREKRDGKNIWVNSQLGIILAARDAEMFKVFAREREDPGNAILQLFNISPQDASELFAKYIEADLVNEQMINRLTARQRGAFNTLVDTLNNKRRTRTLKQLFCLLRTLSSEHTCLKRKVAEVLGYNRYMFF